MSEEGLALLRCGWMFRVYRHPTIESQAVADAQYFGVGSSYSHVASTATEAINGVVQYIVDKVYYGEVPRR